MKRLALAVLAVLVSACVTYPPPKIEGNRYQNYRYGITLELPGEPWKQTEKLPAWFERWMHAADLSTSTIKLALFNNQTNAFIVVNCWKDPQNIYRMSDSGAYQAFEYLLELKKEESLKSNQITRFEYDVGPWTPRLHWTVEVDTETEVQKASVIRKGNNYPIHNDTHFIEIMLWSNRLTYIENLRVFYNVYESLAWGEHLMKPTTE